MTTKLFAIDANHFKRTVTGGAGVKSFDKTRKENSVLYRSERFTKIHKYYIIIKRRSFGEKKTSISR